MSARRKQEGSMGDLSDGTVVAKQRSRRDTGLHNRLVGTLSLRDNPDKHLDTGHGGRSVAADEHELVHSLDDNDLVDGRDRGSEVNDHQSDHDERRSDDGSKRSDKGQIKVAARYAHYSVDRLEEILVGENRWCGREAVKVLVEEYPDPDDFTTFPVYADISTVSDIFRIGAPALAARFREVDPLVWTTLIEALGEKDDIAIQ